uniref:Uncharacterized protein n=1 Tax=Chromera velia CCMP2878 TaxID=1169474 RepID=A0A0G4GGR3_9ALVE|eukprot:Cvel_21836.t1-p1 / transcript=Cvel_21836.t1 / gene=Cvel_21836 / organism=Chromera_velia_CCMP2878 / gene_product=hypothetical protein / transcript_product=hypothetical protein / location=Cvel_scaffold2085:5129-5650(-) / protein_length=174 / sequence_SO=supercontig / SO=protein_coding / is_pseudo=false
MGCVASSVPLPPGGAPSTPLPVPGQQLWTKSASQCSGWSGHQYRFNYNGAPLAWFDGKGDHFLEFAIGHEETNAFPNGLKGPSGRDTVQLQLLVEFAANDPRSLDVHVNGHFVGRCCVETTGSWTKAQKFEYGAVEIFRGSPVVLRLSCKHQNFPHVGSVALVWPEKKTCRWSE